MNDRLLNTFGSAFTTILLLVAVGLLAWQNIKLRDELVNCYRDQTKDLVHLSTTPLPK